MIEPTIGRVIWYHRAGISLTEQPLAALIARVNDDGSINVGGFESNGVPFNDHNVKLLDEEQPDASQTFASWMPYQKGQAAKTDESSGALLGRLEALEKHVAESVGTRLMELHDKVFGANV